MSLTINIDFNKLVDFIKTWLNKINIGHIVLFSLILHFFVIASPNDGGKIFDEAHYIAASNATLQGLAANAEHMPLAKLVIAVFIKIFGDYWFAWRFPIVIMGAISIYVFYLIAKRFMPDKWALVASSFLLFDVIFFVHSSIYVLDMPSILFGLLGIHLYLSKNYKWSALSFGVSFLMKELALFFLGAILFYHLFTSVKGKISRTSLKKLGVFTLVLVVVAGGGLWMYDLAYKPSSATQVVVSQYNQVVVDQNGNPLTTITSMNNVTKGTPITNPVAHLTFALNYFKGLVPAIVTPDKDLRQPWSWVLPIGDVFNSPHYLTTAVTTTAGSVSVTRTLIDWVSQVNPFVEYMLFPIIFLGIINWLMNRRNEDDRLMILSVSWMLTAYMPWLFLGLFVQRMTFNYYILYTIPAIALGIPYFWRSMPVPDKYKYILVGVHLLLTATFFLGFYPVNLMR